MNQAQGDAILQAVRATYAAGFKSSNKVYNLNQSDPEKIKKRSLNQLAASGIIGRMRAGIIPATTRAGNCGEMALAARDLAIQAGHGAVIGCVRDPGDHAFCTVDYVPDNNAPGHVADMFQTNAPNAWVIDPWMNISCSFNDYPAWAAQKLSKWSNDGKEIIFVGRPTDPISQDYVTGFFNTGPLIFQ